MANVYSRIYLQLVFSPIRHENVIPAKHQKELQKFTTGIIQNKKHKLIYAGSCSYFHRLPAISAIT
jgi:hypothetical protein